MPSFDSPDRHSQAEARLRWLEAAQRMSAAVNAVGDLDALLRRLLDEVLTATGAHRGAAGVVTNLQRIAEVQAELQRALALKARAEGAVRTGRAVGHELGSPLASIMGLVSLLVDDPRLPADVVYDLRLMGAEADRAAELLRHFASIARYAEMPSPAGPQLDVRRAADGAELEDR
jgi:signal transduction histidine kinase